MPGLGRFAHDPKLQQDLERYIKFSDGASRILAIAQNPLQCLEAAKTLFVSNAQLFCCLKQIQREKVKEAHSVNQKGDGVTNGTSDPPWSTLATVRLSDIRIPLIWQNAPLGASLQRLASRVAQAGSYAVENTADNAAGVLDYGDQPCDGYSVFCIVRIGDTIKDTRLVFDIVPGTADVEFDDELIFENVAPDFCCVIEIYAYPKPSLKGSSVFSRRRPGIINSDNYRKSYDQQESQSVGSTLPYPSSYYDLIGRRIITLSDIGTVPRARTLDVGPQLLSSSRALYSFEERLNKPQTEVAESCAEEPVSCLYTAAQPSAVANVCDLPLFGNVCFRLVAQPNSAIHPFITGLLWIRKLTASPIQMSARLYYCELRNRHLFAYSVFERCVVDGAASARPISTAEASGTESRNSSNRRNSSDPSNFDAAESGERPTNPQLIFVAHGRLYYSRIKPDLVIPINSKSSFLDPEPLARPVPITQPFSKTFTHAPLNTAVTPEPVTVPTTASSGCEEPVFTKKPTSPYSSLKRPRPRMRRPRPPHPSRSAENLFELRGGLSVLEQIVFRRSRSADMLVNGQEPFIPANIPKPDTPTYDLFPACRTPRGNLLSYNPFHSLESMQRIVEGTASTAPFEPVAQSHFHLSAVPNLGRFSRSLDYISVFPTVNRELTTSEMQPSLPPVCPRPVSPPCLAQHDRSTEDVPTTTVPEATLETLDSPASSRTITINVRTFRIATTTTTTNTESSVSSSTIDRGNNKSDMTLVFEFAVATPSFLDQLSLQPADPNVPLDCVGDPVLTDKWLLSFQRHVQEQETWGVDAFLHHTPLTQHCSTPVETSARRSMHDQRSSMLI